MSRSMILVLSCILRFRTGLASKFSKVVDVRFSTILSIYLGWNPKTSSYGKHQWFWPYGKRPQGPTMRNRSIAVCTCLVGINYHTITGLVEGKIYRKPWVFALNIILIDINRGFLKMVPETNRVTLAFTTYLSLFVRCQNASSLLVLEPEQRERTTPACSCPLLWRWFFFSVFQRPAPFKAFTPPGFSTLQVATATCFSGWKFGAHHVGGGSGCQMLPRLPRRCGCCWKGLRWGLNMPVVLWW